MATNRISQNHENLGIRSGAPIGYDLQFDVVATSDNNRIYRLVPSGKVGKIIDAKTIDLSSFEDGLYGEAGEGILFKASPDRGDIHRFNASASGLTWKDVDRSTDITTAAAGDVGRYDGTNWVKQHAMRSDVRNALFAQNWEIKIVSQGYQQQRDIDALESDGICKVFKAFDHVEPMQELLIEYVLVPRMMFPMNIFVYSDSHHEITIKVSNAHVYQPSDSQLWTLGTVAKGKSVEIKAHLVDRLYFQLPSTVTAGTMKISWGEHQFRTA